MTCVLQVNFLFPSFSLGIDYFLDFGISIWKGTENGALPAYAGKEHYKLTNDKATLTYNFDFR